MKPSDLERFRKICGMLSSPHEGERAAAAAKATHLLKLAGQTWADVAVDGTADTRHEVELLQAMLEQTKRYLAEAERQRDAARAETTTLRQALEEARTAPSKTDLDETLRNEITAVLAEHDQHVVELKDRTVDFLRGVLRHKRWTDKQRDAVSRTLSWVANLERERPT